MSMTFPEPTRLSAASTTDLSARREFYASALGRYIRRRRTELGMTIEQAAKLAGLELSGWMALEAGWIPEDRELSPVAEVLEVGVLQLAFMALVARCNREAAAAELS